MSKYNKPHVVLLGAGASVAVLNDFNGTDKYGKKTSVMNNFIQELGLDEIFNEYNYKPFSRNLEDIYSDLYEKPEYAELRSRLEVAIEDYYFDMVIPDEPTIYDMLILSLTHKDCIATFNWDPLLVQAYLRVKKITNDLPEIYYLHGNVFIGYCEKDFRFGAYHGKCPICNNRYSSVPLLYPIKNKNYDLNSLISSFLRQFSQQLKDAYIFTIFGYSAPKSDYEAVNLLKEIWNVSGKKLEQFEIIDILSKDELDEKWKDFEFESHYEYHTSFYDTALSKFPRSSVESLIRQNENAEFIDNSPKLKKGLSWEELKSIFRL